MISENTKKVCNFFLYWTIKNNIKEVLSKMLFSSLQPHYGTLSFKLIRIAIMLAVITHSYYIFGKTGISYFPFIYVAFKGAHFLSALPMPLFLVYFMHKNGFLQGASYAEFRQIARIFRNWDGANSNYLERNWQNRLLARLNEKEQWIFFRLGADIKDLQLLNNNSLDTCLQEDSLQWMAMQAFVKTEKPFSFMFAPQLKIAYEHSKQKVALEKTVLNEDPEFIDIQRLHL